MNRRWYGVPPLGGCASPDRLKPELHAVGSSRSQCTATRNVQGASALAQSRGFSPSFLSQAAQVKLAERKGNCPTHSICSKAEEGSRWPPPRKLRSSMVSS